MGNGQGRQGAGEEKERRTFTASSSSKTRGYLRKQFFILGLVPISFLFCNHTWFRQSLAYPISYLKKCTTIALDSAVQSQRPRVRTNERGRDFSPRHDWFATDSIRSFHTPVSLFLFTRFVSVFTCVGRSTLRRIYIQAASPVLLPVGF